MYRTHTCGELSAQSKGKTITLSGWVHRRRDHGGVIFIDLRDHYGLTQIVFDPNFHKESWEVADKVRPEYVLKVTGEVRPRLEGQANPNMETGEIEVYINEIEILNEAKTPPFEIDQEKTVNEELRLTYRYLDLRHDRMRDNMILRTEMSKTIRDFFHNNGFLEIETPILIKGTPEGSREYMVPSRLHPGNFYVLPQSPQQLKQLLMIGGFDKYFQIARCFRDEDQRGDRQPEFTQFEIEASFVEEEDILNVTEQCFVELTKKHAPGKKFPEKFPRLTWHEAMRKYGSDKPDLRFEMEFVELTEEKENCGFGIFEKSEYLFALRVEKKLGELARRELDELAELAQKYGAGGLAWVRVGDDSGPVAKNSKPEFLQTIKEKTNAQDGDLVLFGAGNFEKSLIPLGAVRSALGDKFNLKNPDEFAYCWICDFPMFEQKEDGSIGAEHHPFTRPLDEDQELLKSDPLKARAHAYDIVLNGVELGGGSLRIHEPDLQAQIFDILQISKEDAENRFGHLLKAFQYGAPPHGGIAMGLDRVVMLFANEPNIREVIPFPKNQNAQDLMTGAPSELSEEDVKEANIKIVKPK